MSDTYHFIGKIWKEGAWYVAEDIFSGVVSQGRTIEDARENLKEAVMLYFDDVELSTYQNNNQFNNTILMPMEIQYGAISGR